MINDCFKYYKGCETCQKFGSIQLGPPPMFHPVVKAWPFKRLGVMNDIQYARRRPISG